MSLYAAGCLRAGQHLAQPPRTAAGHTHSQPCRLGIDVRLLHARSAAAGACRLGGAPGLSARCNRAALRSEEHTSELQSLMRISYAVFCLKKKKHLYVYI